MYLPDRSACILSIFHISCTRSWMQKKSVPDIVVMHPTELYLLPRVNCVFRTYSKSNKFWNTFKTFPEQHVLLHIFQVNFFHFHRLLIQLRPNDDVRLLWELHHFGISANVINWLNICIYVGAEYGLKMIFVFVLSIIRNKTKNDQINYL